MLLTFTINKQLICRTDCEIPVAKSENYLYAQFSFSNEWVGTKTAIFNNGTAYSVILDEDNKCLVPWEVITESGFSVSVYCGERITANVAFVKVLPSGYIEGQTPADPTPTVYEQIIEELNGKLEPENLIAGANITITINGKSVIISSTGGGSGTGDYDDLENKPSINSVELSGNKTSAQLGVQSEIFTPLSASAEPLDITTLNGKYVATENIKLVPIEWYVKVWSEEEAYETIEYLYAGDVLFITAGTRPYFTLINGGRIVYCNYDNSNKMWLGNALDEVDWVMEEWYDKRYFRVTAVLNGTSNNIERNSENGVYIGDTGTWGIRVPISATQYQSIRVRQGGLVIKTQNKIEVIGDNMMVCTWNSDKSGYDILDLADVETLINNKVQEYVDELISTIPATVGRFQLSLANVNKKAFTIIGTSATGYEGLCLSLINYGLEADKTYQVSFTFYTDMQTNTGYNFGFELSNNSYIGTGQNTFSTPRGTVIDLNRDSTPTKYTATFTNTGVGYLTFFFPALTGTGYAFIKDFEITEV